eukprot:TRINITY_DN67449_c5_g2_i1.p1 TRINITY_DN67449_c5_g2~~TRINITY_DN67449_c5_g2_i1.p1  ORF type:complete len:393 (-),score=10.80 TRINITY_DN67449_c5_g2_i1:2427-3446(-)
MNYSEPIVVCVTGAAGQIAYSLCPMIAMGQMFGAHQPVILHLLDIDMPAAKQGLAGLVMELEDCHYPLLVDVVSTVDTKVAFKKVDYVVACGAFPRLKGMERKDLLQKNAGIFKEQALAIRDYAKPTTKVVVVGNPANTNAMLLAKDCGLPSKNITALTRLDHNRATGLIARKLKLHPTEVVNVIIWGNHSSTQYPEVGHANTAPRDGLRQSSVTEAIADDTYLTGDFIKEIQGRGAAVIEMRGKSSATSAARAIVDHVRDWHCGTKPTQWVSMAVYSDGSHYGIPPGIVYSMPCVCKGGDWQVVDGLYINDFDRKMMDLTAKELVEEKELAEQITARL